MFQVADGSEHLTKDFDAWENGKLGEGVENLIEVVGNHRAKVTERKYEIQSVFCRLKTECK